MTLRSLRFLLPLLLCGSLPAQTPVAKDIRIPQWTSSSATTNRILNGTTDAGKYLRFNPSTGVLEAATVDLTAYLPLAGGTLTGGVTGTTLNLSGALVALTVNGNTITTGTGILTLAAGKTLTASNTLTLAGTDGSTLNIGTGGTLGTAAYTAATAYQAVDADLTSWAAITRASGFDAFTAAPSSANLLALLTSKTGTGNAVFSADAVFTGSLQLPNGAAPTTDAFGEIAGDNNAWASGRGAPQWFDGTANTWLVGALASDTPTNGQVPTWNTGGTITWETPSGSGSVDEGADYTWTGTHDFSGATLTLPDDWTIATLDVTTFKIGGTTILPTATELNFVDGVTSAIQTQLNAKVATTRADFEEFCLSDETTAITTGTAKVTWRAPFAMTITAVRASLTTVSSSGTPTVDINEAGTTILSTKLTVDASEKTSTTAAAAAVISDTAIADDAEITFDIDTAGTGAAGLKVKIYYTR